MSRKNIRRVLNRHDSGPADCTTPSQHYQPYACGGRPKWPSQGPNRQGLDPGPRPWHGVCVVQAPWAGSALAYLPPGQRLVKATATRSGGKSGLE